MRVEEFFRNLKVTDPKPVYFLFGEERFFQLEMIEALTDELITPENREFNLESFDAKGSRVEDWLGAANTFSFFGGKKLVIVRNLNEVFWDPIAVSILLGYLEKPCPNACLVLTADKVDRKRKLDKALAGLETAVECSIPREKDLAAWLKQRSESLGYSISLRTARLLVDRVGVRPGMLVSELEKLATYAGHAHDISEEMISEVTDSQKLENVFQLTDALKTKNLEGALYLLRNQLLHGEEPLKILGMIAWQFRMIWEARSYHQQKLSPAKIAREMGSKLFVVEKALQFARAFSLKDLDYSFRSLCQADRELKSSGREPEMILESLIVKLCSTG